jgi:hypothetical protein
MLRVHKRSCSSVAFGSAILCGFGLPATAALYHVDGSAGADPHYGVPPYPQTYSVDLNVPVGRGVTFDYGSGVHAAADSIASGIGVGSHTYAQLIIPVVYGGPFDLDASSTATATFSDMVVSGPVGNTISTSLNMELTGGFLFGSAADPGSTAAVASVQAAIWVYINGTLVGSGGHSERADTRFAPYRSTTGMLAAWGSSNPQIVTPNFDVQSGVPFDVQITLSTFAETLISSSARTGGSAEANSDFSHTFSFNTSGPVFNLPLGYSANSADAHIVGNQFVAAVPGDFNNDGSVNAADYVTWRKGLGTSYTPEQFDIWRTHFGQTSSSGAGASRNTNAAHNVPEPASLLLFMLGCVAAGFVSRSVRF